MPVADTVTVDYATSDGTATAGSDYTETSGTLTLAANETTRTVSVSVLDDAHDEGVETIGFTLSSPSPDRVKLEDASAQGSITNDDLMPKAWAARFGRTVLAVKSDAMAAWTSTGMVSDPIGGNLWASEAHVTRLRLALEGSRPVRPGESTVLTPSLEFGVRHDGGDAETGFGADVGVGLALSDAERGGGASEIRPRGLTEGSRRASPRRWASHPRAARTRCSGARPSPGSARRTTADSTPGTLMYGIVQPHRAPLPPAPDRASYPVGEGAPHARGAVAGKEALDARCGEGEFREEAPPRIVLDRGRPKRNARDEDMLGQPRQG